MGHTGSCGLQKVENIECHIAGAIVYPEGFVGSKRAFLHLKLPGLGQKGLGAKRNNGKGQKHE